jgi:hypothetical protein
MKEIVNIREFTQRYIIEKLGFNVRIQKVEEKQRKQFHITFSVYLKYEIEFSNGLKPTGEFLINNIGDALLKETK